MEDIHDIYGWWDVPFLLWKNPYFILVASLFVLALLILSFLLYKNNKKKLSAPPPEVPLTPYELALKELESIRLILAPGRDKEIATMLCSVIRRYLEKDFHLSFPEKTTEEFLYTINQDKSLDTHALAELTQFLKFCDLAKFAKQHFTPSEQEKIYNLAGSFLKATHDQKVKAAAQISPQPTPVVT